MDTLHRTSEPLKRRRERRPVEASNNSGAQRRADRLLSGSDCYYRGSHGALLARARPSLSFLSSWDSPVTSLLTAMVPWAWTGTTSLYLPSHHRLAALALLAS